MPPPADLTGRELPLHVLKRGHRLVRVHGIGRDPLFFGPAPGVPPTGRWDSTHHRYGTCYFADGAHPCIAFAERFLRDPARTLVPESELRRAAVSLVRVEAAIRVVPFHGLSLRRLGASAGIAHGDHRESRPWAGALHDHPVAPDGVRWRSRLDDDSFAVALFDRARARLAVVRTEALLGPASALRVDECLERYAAAAVG